MEQCGSQTEFFLRKSKEKMIFLLDGGEEEDEGTMCKEYCVLSGEMDCPTEGDEGRCEICDHHDPKSFIASSEEWEVAQRFIRECMDKDIFLQKQDPKLQEDIFVQSCWEENYPYGGAIGGGITYSFTPTSIGMSFKVKYNGTHYSDEKDCTDYDLW